MIQDEGTPSCGKVATSRKTDQPLGAVTLNLHSGYPTSVQLPARASVRRWQQQWRKSRSAARLTGPRNKTRCRRPPDSNGDLCVIAKKAPHKRESHHDSGSDDARSVSSSSWSAIWISPSSSPATQILITCMQESCCTLVAPPIPLPGGKKLCAGTVLQFPVLGGQQRRLSEYRWPTFVVNQRLRKTLLRGRVTIMPVNRVAENVLGTMGTICWTIQLVPQIWHTYRSKSVEGLSEHFMLLCAIAGPFLGTYSVVQNLNVPLILQPQVFGVLCLMSWAQCQYYGHKRSRTTSIAIFFAALVVFAGFEVGMIYAVRPSYNAGNQAPTMFFGIFSTVLIACGLMPQYYEIYKYKEVIGISLLFMTIDALGGVFNDLSLAFKGDFDVIAGVTYSLVVVLDGGILLLALILNPLARRRRKRLAAVNTAVPDVEAPANVGYNSGLEAQEVPRFEQDRGEKLNGDVRDKKEEVEVSIKIKDA